MEKKAQSVLADMTFWIYRFILIGLIAFAFVIIVGNKYSEHYDVRPMEASIISEKLAGCITDKSVDSESILSCMNFKDSKDYYLELNMTSMDSNFSKTITLGKSLLKSDCLILDQGTKFTKMPLCSDSRYIILLNGERVSVKIETDIGKYDQNQ